MGLTDLEKGIFLGLFNRGGYVLDFSTNEFDIFTAERTGVPLCSHYNLSKGKSLMSFLHDSKYGDDVKEKLLFDLFDYYETTALFERECGEYSDNNEYKNKYKKCKIIRERCRTSNVSIAVSLQELATEIDSSYIDSQIKLAMDHQNINPTLSIGKCKELIESICKTILDKSNIAYDKNLSINKLVRETMSVMNVLPNNISDDLKASRNLKSILSNLSQIADNIAELRNAYGDGHGKSSSYSGLQPRHAKLAIGATSTLVYFLWETFKLKQQ